MRLLRLALFFATLAIVAVPFAVSAGIDPTVAIAPDLTTAPPSAAPPIVASPPNAPTASVPATATTVSPDFSAAAPIAASAPQRIDAVTPKSETAMVELENTANKMTGLFSNHVSLMTYGFGALAIFATLLVLVGGLLPFLAIKGGRDALQAQKELMALQLANMSMLVDSGKELKAQMDSQSCDMKALLCEGKKHVDTLAEQATQAGPSSTLSTKIVNAAQDKAREGKSTGTDDLWSKAILAQKSENWERAYTFWTAILEDDPKNATALFWAALACQKLFDKRGGKSSEVNLLNKAAQFFAKIPNAKVNSAVLNNWGNLLLNQGKMEADPGRKSEMFTQAEEKYAKAAEYRQDDAGIWNNWGNLLQDRAEAETDPSKKSELLTLAETKYAKATEYQQNDAEIWSNWGNLLQARAEAETDPDRKSELFTQAEEKHAKATECQPDYAGAWNNWGNLLKAWAATEADPSKKSELLSLAEKKYAKATECQPDHAGAWNNWGNLLLARAQAETDPSKKSELLTLAEKKYAKATECQPDHAGAWNNWGNLLLARAQAETDPDRKSELFTQAEEKHAKATECQPDHAGAWNNWGNLLLARAQAETDPDRKSELFSQAEEKYRKAIDIQPQLSAALNNLCVLFLQQAQIATSAEKDLLLQHVEECAKALFARGDFSSSYNFACCAAQRNDVATTIQRLEQAHAHGALPPWDHIEQDKDFDLVRDSPEFKTFMEKVFNK